MPWFLLISDAQVTCRRTVIGSPRLAHSTLVRPRIDLTPTGTMGIPLAPVSLRVMGRSFCSDLHVFDRRRTADRALRRRGRRRKSVEDMGTEPVSRWNVGVLEVRRRITNHAEELHYLPRPDILWVGEGNDTINTEL